MTRSSRHQGYVVAAAAIGINLALGVLYSWSIFKVAIKESIEGGGAFRWRIEQLNDPYSVACLVFAFSMILAGRIQDRFGPRVTAFAGGLLVGLGFLIVSRSSGYWAWVTGFGVLAGLGFGFGYSAATPPALKWFPPARTGLVAGLVVSGFGLASVYIAPLSRHLIDRSGLQQAMLTLGAGFMVAVSLLSLRLVNPPAGYVAARGAPAGGALPPPSTTADVPPSRMVRTRTAWLLWGAFFAGAGAGLMVIGSIGEMAKKALGGAAFVAVVVMAVGNAGGRIAAGVVSDRLGRPRTLMLLLGTQAALMFLGAWLTAGHASGVVVLLLLAAAIGFNYGGNLSLFPSFTKDRFGLKHFGMNYGIIFTAWGVGGFVMSRLSQTLYAASHSYRSSFICAGCLLLAGCALATGLRERGER
ncbi:MAG: L-lactate MFS transporter [Candidatus Krumholzibacteriia bacterium]